MYEYTATQVGTPKLSQLRHYISLLRFHYHSSFIGILLGAFLITRDLQWPLLWRIFLLYVSLNVLLYGGLYSLNAITDAEGDSRHPWKKNRPVASGEISRKTAGLFAAGLIVAGFVTGWTWLGLESMPVYVLFLVLNVSYSLCFRNIFALDLIFNTDPRQLWQALLREMGWQYRLLAAAPDDLSSN